jgi:hypothetical protein
MLSWVAVAITCGRHRRLLLLPRTDESIQVG